MAKSLPSPDTMRQYARILLLPQRDQRGFLTPPGEIIEAAALALRTCATMVDNPDRVFDLSLIVANLPQE